MKGMEICSTFSGKRNAKIHVSLQEVFQIFPQFAPMSTERSHVTLFLPSVVNPVLNSKMFSLFTSCKLFLYKHNITTSLQFESVTFNIYINYNIIVCRFSSWTCLDWFFKDLWVNGCKDKCACHKQEAKLKW